MSDHYADQFYYSRGLVEELLPWALHGAQPPSRGLEEQPGSGSDPAEGGNFTVMLVDVRRALAALPTDDWTQLTDQVVAGRAVSGHLLDQMVDYLGGPRP